jgi:hypothetical protein
MHSWWTLTDLAVKCGENHVEPHEVRKFTCALAWDSHAKCSDAWARGGRQRERETNRDREREREREGEEGGERGV